MKPGNVDTAVEIIQAIGGSQHDLWVGTHGKEVLTITIDKHSKAFPPDVKQCELLNDMIQGLARAANAVAYHAIHDSSFDTEFAMQRPYIRGHQAPGQFDRQSFAVVAARAPGTCKHSGRYPVLG